MADTVIMPKLGFDMAEGTLVRWVVQEGEPVTKGAVLAEIETDKATVEVESPFDGNVARHLVAQGDIVPINTPIAIITAPGEALPIDQTQPAPSASKPVSMPQPAPTTVGTDIPSVQMDTSVQADVSDLPGSIKASPLARRMASERSIDLRQVTGTGPGGRVTKRDVENYTPTSRPTPVSMASSAHVTPSGIPVLATGEVPADQVVQISRLRQAIGRRMVEAKSQLPHFYITYEYNVAKLLELRKQVNTLLPDEEKTSVNDYIVRAVSMALREFPNLNASLAGDQVIRHGQVNVGVAVAVEGGLLTVVCKNSDMKSVRQISSEVKYMAGRARDGKVRPDDIEGSTFSISNLGMFDVENFIAIINPPEAAILAVGSAREAPVIHDGQVVPGWRMKATISVDHRVSDGAEAARFMQALAKFIEQPLRLLV